MGVHNDDIALLLSKEKDGSLIICKSKLYALAGNSIVTNCMTAMFEKLFFPDGEHYHDKNGQLSLFLPMDTFGYIKVGRRISSAHKMMFECKVTHVSFLPSPYEGKDTKHHRRAAKGT